MKYNINIQGDHINMQIKPQSCPCCDYFEKEISKQIISEQTPLLFTAIMKLDEPVINPDNNEMVELGKLSVNINYCLYCGREFKTNKVGD